MKATHEHQRHLLTNPNHKQKHATSLENAITEGASNLNVLEYDNQADNCTPNTNRGKVFKGQSTGLTTGQVAHAWRLQELPNPFKSSTVLVNMAHSKLAIESSARLNRPKVQDARLPKAQV